MILTPFVIGVFLSYILEPIVAYLQSKGFERKKAVILVYFILVISIVVLLFYIIPLILYELGEMAQMFPDYTKEVEKHVIFFRNLYKTQLPQAIQQIINRTIQRFEMGILDFLHRASSTILSLFPHFFSAILGPIIAFYILKDLDILKKNLLTILLKVDNKAVFWIKNIDKTIGHYIRCQFIICLTIALMTTFVLFLLKVDFALVIGLIAGIFNIIPYFGPIIGAIPAVAIALMKYPDKIPWIILSFFIIQEVESGIISPNIMGESVGIHPLTVIFSLLIGNSFFGIWGLLLAVPVAALLKMLLEHVFFEP